MQTVHTCPILFEHRSIVSRKQVCVLTCYTLVGLVCRPMSSSFSSPYGNIYNRVGSDTFGPSEGKQQCMEMQWHCMFANVAEVVKKDLYCAMRCHENSSRRIFVLKLIFLLYWVDLWSNCRRMMGFKVSDHSTPLWGVNSLRLTLHLFLLIMNLFAQS